MDNLELMSKISNIKLVAFDMDGTLLPDNKEITDYTLRTLKRMDELGFKICICSGRSFNGVYKYKEIRHLIDYYVCFEGSYIVDNNDKNNPKLLQQISIPNELITKVIDTVSKNNIMAALLCEKYGYCSNCVDYIKHSVSIWGAEPCEKSYNGLLDVIKHEKAYIILTYGTKEQMDHLNSVISHHVPVDIDVIRAYLDFDKFKDIHHTIVKAPAINKWNGIESVLKLTGLKQENVMAFGDWLNDIEMIRNAGMGIAMKNAENEVITVSKSVTDYDNNQDGAAKFLNKIFNLFN
ncbi:MAG: Cof-type HAD-IIB family hydrolase [Candidatus Wallbacteria bacterium]